MKSIWSTPEFEAICRNLQYVDYLNFHKLYRDNNLVTSEPISEELYRDIRTAICRDMITQLSLKGFELDKCILLCENCHREEHERLFIKDIS